MTPPGPGFRHRLRVRYSEVDYQGIVYNSHYLTYFDLGIHEFFRDLPYDYTSIGRRTGNDFNTVRALVEWQRPLHFDEQFEVEVWPGRVGRTSVTFAFALWVAGERRARAIGEVVWVHADQKAGRAVPLPDALRELLEARYGVGGGGPAAG